MKQQRRSCQEPQAFQHIGQYKTDTIPPPRYIFRSPNWTPGAIATKMWDAMSRTYLCPCAKFQPNPFSSFGEGASKKTDIHTNGILNSPHYHGW